MLKSVIWSSGALAALWAGSALAQTAPAAAPGADIGATVGSGAQIGAPGALGGSILGSPITPSSPLTSGPGVVGSLAPASSIPAPLQAQTQVQTSGQVGLSPPAASPAAAAAAVSSGVNASASAPSISAPASPVAVGAVVRSQSGVQMGTIARLIPGANGYVSGVVLRTPSGALRETPLTALGLSAGALVTTYNTDQINGLPEFKAAQ